MELDQLPAKLAQVKKQADLWLKADRARYCFEGLTGSHRCDGSHRCECFCGGPRTLFKFGLVQKSADLEKCNLAFGLQPTHSGSDSLTSNLNPT